MFEREEKRNLEISNALPLRRKRFVQEQSLIIKIK